MKVKIMLLILALVTPTKEYAQTEINKTLPVQAGQTIVMHFDYPELIQITTWERNEISIQGEVSINGGENDDAFILENTTTGNVIKINSLIKDLKKLPERITIMRDGQKIMFRDKAELNKYQSQHGRGYNNMSWGPDIDIQLEIKVPRNTETIIQSVYGMVEIKNFAGPLTVESTYGGVDAALVERAVGELTAETNYGQIYSNLDIKFGGDQVKGKDFYMFVTAKPGSGPKYNFESKYGNVYLRKAAN
ncbi:MAG: hypothetical protein WD824_16470 [Cyclobacteriaceae bacterium]